MAQSLNKVELIGRLGADPEVKNLNNGAVANLRIATSDVWKDRDGERQEKTEWHSISIWNEKTIEFAEKYLKKGDLVRLEGKIQTRKWQDQDGKDRYSTEIHIPKFASLDALMKLSFDNDNDRGGNDRGGGSRSSGRSSRDDDRGGRDDDRGGSRSSSRSSSRSRDDDRGGDDRGRDDDRGSRSSSRSSSRDDRNDDRGGGRSSGRSSAPSRNNDMDDDIPF
ncbi:single-strand DNA-binding protein [Bradyrhizobium sp. AZCC 1610]|uniref:single-stranded DNA-binding protein n=1 Tax=Bradyrhizobium sp. AZCC 1610 TaxID=3117020 RepID=UPI002FF16419